MRYAVAVALVALVGSLSRADDFDTKQLDELVGKAMTAFRVPGAAIVVVKNDKVVYLRGFGVTKLGGEEKVTPETVFAIASCSKAFTATAAAMFVADGKMAWDDSVRKHLDGFRLSDTLADRDVTLRDLLSHRSGMPRHDFLWVGQTEDTDELIRRFGRANRSTSFRSTWEYSNVPFTAASTAIGKVAGSDWATVMRERIFKPLGMASSYCTPREAQATANHATPHYRKLDDVVMPVEWDKIDFVRGAGAIGSTAKDMGQWLRFQLGNGKFDGKQLLAEKQLKETHTPQMLFRPEGAFAPFFPAKVSKFTTYGLGWFVHDYRGQMCLSHGGTLTGFRAQCMLLPEKKIGVFAVGNVRPSYFTETVAKAVLDQALGVTGEDWVKHHVEVLAKLTEDLKKDWEKRAKERKKDTKPSREAKAYAGKYEEDAYGTATITADGDKLTLKWGKFTFRLDHHHFDTFTAVPVAPASEVFKFDRSLFEVQFQLGANGDVETLRFLDQEFRRIPDKKDEKK